MAAHGDTELDQQAAAARTNRVKLLYDEIIDGVMEDLQDDCQLEGIDEHVLVDLKQVCLASHRLIPHSTPVTTHSHPRFAQQRWLEKLKACGALGPPVEGGIVRTVGAGVSLVAAQYAIPDATAADATSVARPGSGDPSLGGPRPPQPGDLGSGAPRGAEMYTPLFDGTPDGYIVRARPPNIPTPHGKCDR